MTTLEQLAKEAAGCTRCDLYQRATATVFGEGRQASSLALVGEQPGDQEDKQGHPFVGPAGRLLDRALRESGIDRADAYVTNAVKHFKWEARGKRRIHQRPNGTEIMACRGWLEAELAVVGPRVAVALGAVAGEAIFGRGFKVRDHRSRLEDVTVGGWHGTALSTVHPSSILRARDDNAREEALAGFVADLVKAREALAA
ncbi:MAG TPA: UdgX family uracil-DNA binding protein [Streptosporangiaceae bacterium]|jgi:DNA polymerase|nr:UdgX family uracil-DNA binding protein [Streptosporangiaceae bacterium]